MLARQAGLRPTELIDAIYAHRNCDAARHLYRVTSGLESMIVGEAEVQGQVKRSYEAALAARTTGPLTNKLFRAALATGKRVRTETSIGAGGASVASVAVEAARVDSICPSRIIVLMQPVLPAESAPAIARAAAVIRQGVCMVAPFYTAFHPAPMLETCPPSRAGGLGRRALVRALQRGNAEALPPSTVITHPVVAAAPAKNTNAPPTSSAVVSRARRFARKYSSAGMVRLFDRDSGGLSLQRSARTRPALTAFERMPCGPRSIAYWRIRASSAASGTAYGPASGPWLKTPDEALKSKTPPTPWSRKTSEAARATF